MEEEWRRISLPVHLLGPSTRSLSLSRSLALSLSLSLHVGMRESRVPLSSLFALLLLSAPLLVSASSSNDGGWIYSLRDCILGSASTLESILIPGFTPMSDTCLQLKSFGVCIVNATTQASVQDPIASPLAGLLAGYAQALLAKTLALVQEQESLCADLGSPWDIFFNGTALPIGQPLLPVKRPAEAQQPCTFRPGAGLNLLQPNDTFRLALLSGRYNM